MDSDVCTNIHYVEYPLSNIFFNKEEGVSMIKILDYNQVTPQKIQMFMNITTCKIMTQWIFE